MLQVSPGKVIVDATVGAGGHSSMILERLGGSGTFIGIDRDLENLETAKERLQGSGAEARFFHADFRDIGTVFEQAGIDRADGFLFDLGVSSMQLDDSSRGFSFDTSGPLDMRMDRESSLSAADIVNGYPVEELARIFREYGDEKHADRIAQAVVKERSEEPITTTGRFAEVLRKASGGRRGTRRPEAALFMAVRIEVNSEFESLRQGLKSAIDRLGSGGRICVISFHSGEDRIVKRLFRDTAAQGAVRVLTRRPLVPSPAEAAANSRSRSARMRVCERALN
jgi:16S rRNA (cytosine1402-N4)-methyltransferase